MRFLLGVVFGILLAVAVVVAVVATGSFNLSATVPPSRTERKFATFVLNRSVAKRAPDRKNPLASSAERRRQASSG